MVPTVPVSPLGRQNSGRLRRTSGARHRFESDPARSRETRICNEGVFARSRETRIVPLRGVDDGASTDPLKNNTVESALHEFFRRSLHSRDEMAAD